MHKSELLLPAGSLVKLKTAILYGADAVYAGTPDMCLRAQSKFSLEELEEGIEFVHKHGKKIYLTLNLFMHNRDVAKLPQFVDTLRRLRPDGVLIADPGVFMALEMGQRDDDIRIHQRPADLGLFNIVAPLDGNGNLIVALQAVGNQDMAAGGIRRKAVLVSGFDML